ncbi:hypothetical protein [Lentilactobacillus hilgardii]|uniref:Uncharacterized protein n=1 Tax=Lentilactobacillus hilgardii (strain ATCC 8290 / DSM 20176 / CCUG 30140 / JCM 1155 / KCTC 3500 / NBRC 15886 / NCIMB 8040 / NRRL B-1843 / 9) TaxID=1423757 RepID=C0XI51_LENH9|nr:hypothetical protein [Lentilactobacillus hilgardii]EEI21065.1 hypothetical protein HMPREF0497_0133 [Lentilactobacillus buchneri ATCC 11577]EEI24989.1 hypothetical protein HMPREF0519_0912 [Lentilactobacillus hilgardii DSM 20176 = ATCC 8290]MCP9332602.1 hypothetical protein [Lentilactobacillus hilgardii]MCP9349209.1 hypothetical protein [Lentilactobacillus hilgardii]MCP9352078.1 hypothetical protein [Lentilactobacillus hilgardii]
MMKKRQPSKLIIRKRSSLLTMLRRAIILIGLWMGTGYIVYINICFLLNIYSDALVSDYLVLNLSFRSYAIFALLVVVIASLMIIFGWLRIRKLKRQAKNRE